MKSEWLGATGGVRWLLVLGLCGCSPATVPPPTAPTSTAPTPTAAAAVAVAAAGTDVEQSAGEPLSAFPQSLLSIRTADGKAINFKIWTADNQARDEQGLMFVHKMDLHAGMLFVFPENRPVTMWMRNTYISLDLLFMNQQGKIDYIAANATPLSDNIIGPPGLEYAVLELNGGACALLGINVGDTVVHQSFQPNRSTR